MKWDRDWLKTIRSTRKLVDVMGPKLQDIADPVDREIVRRQFHILVNRFKGDVEMGYNPNDSARDLLDLTGLIHELVCE